MAKGTRHGLSGSVPMAISETGYAAEPSAARSDTDTFRDAMRVGLSTPQKTVPARYLYDARGSALFEDITQLPEYYPTRTEIGLLEARAADINRLSAGVDMLVEFGSGSSRKTPLVLRATNVETYIPVDIAGDFLRQASDSVAALFPKLSVHPVEADFTRPFALPSEAQGSRVLGFFPGSTIGNLSPRAAVDLLRSFRDTLGPGARMLIGIDTRKNPRLLEAAYDDAQGVTAAFNLNLITRINAELAGTLPPDAFEHCAVWNDRLGRIEMHLMATRDITFDAADHRFHMRSGETIHTENSYKYRPEEAAFLARAGGWEPMARWTDTRELFSVEYWRCPPDRLEP